MTAWREVRGTKAAGAGLWIGPHHPCKLQIRGRHMWLKTNIKIDKSCKFKQADTTEPHRRTAREPRHKPDLPEDHRARGHPAGTRLSMERHRAVGSWSSLSAWRSELGGAATWLPGGPLIFLLLTWVWGELAWHFSHVCNMSLLRSAVCQNPGRIKMAHGRREMWQGKVKEYIYFFPISWINSTPKC